MDQLLEGPTVFSYHQDEDNGLIFAVGNVNFKKINHAMAYLKRMTLRGEFDTGRIHLNKGHNPFIIAVCGPHYKGIASLNSFVQLPNKAGLLVFIRTDILRK